MGNQIDIQLYVQFPMYEISYNEYRIKQLCSSSFERRELTIWSFIQ